MSKRDFFRIIIKLFGLYALVLSLLYYLPQNLIYFFYEFDFWTVIWIILFSGVVLLVYALLILRADKIIDWLKLDRGFDDDQLIIGNFTTQGIVSLATILIGGFLIIDYMPGFLKNLYNSIRSEIDQSGMESLMNVYSDQVYYFDWAVSIINILIGFILLTNYRSIGSWLIRINESKSKGVVDVEEGSN